MFAALTLETFSRRSKSRGRGLILRPIGCKPALFVTYNAAAAAVAACGAI